MSLRSLEIGVTWGVERHHSYRLRTHSLRWKMTLAEIWIANMKYERSDRIVLRRVDIF